MTHLIVEARAGTGKTFTLVLGLAYAVGGKVWRRAKSVLGFEPKPSPQQEAVWDALMAEGVGETVAYLAFNKSIVEEFEAKYKWLVESLAASGIVLKFSTVHSLGNLACKQAQGWRRINSKKVDRLLEEYFDPGDWRRFVRQRGELVRACRELARMARMTLAGFDPTTRKWRPPSDDALEALAARYGIQGANDEAFEAVRFVLEASRRDRFEVDFDDMIWLPVVNGWHVPQHDLVLGDEAQDWNACQQQIILRAGKRLLVCGDRHQAIYGFAGADTRSMDTVAELLESTGEEVKHFPLTVTRRCGKAIVEEARALVPDFEAHPDNPPGEIKTVKTTEALDMYSPGDMVLCRTNAPLVSLAFRLLRMGRKAMIRGRDIGRGLISLIDSLRAESVDDLIYKVDDWYDKQARKISSQKYPNEEQIIALQDKRDCVKAFCEKAATIDEIKATIETLFGDNGKGGVMLSSIHRAKGLEADRVFILFPELVPHPMAKTKEAKEQELNLKYVAITRAIKTLVYVTKDD